MLNKHGIPVLTGSMDRYIPELGSDLTNREKGALKNREMQERFFDALQGEFPAPKFFLAVDWPSRDIENYLVHFVVRTKGLGDVFVNIKSSPKGMHEFKKMQAIDNQYKNIMPFVVKAAASPVEIRETFFAVLKSWLRARGIN